MVTDRCGGATEGDMIGLVAGQGIGRGGGWRR